MPQDDRPEIPVEDDDETLGPCGCTDYHMSDCPTRTGGTGISVADLWEREGYDLLDDYRIEEATE